MNLLRRTPSGSILNVGCGNTIGNTYFSNFSHRYVGADISLVSLVDAKRETDEKTSNFVGCDALQLPFRDNSFDLVISLQTLPLLGAHCQPAIREIARVSSENIIFDLIHRDGLERSDRYTVTERRNGHVLAHYNGYGFSAIGFDSAALPPMLDRMGLEIETLQTLTAYEINNIGKPIYEREPMLFPEEGINQLIYIEAKKRVRA